MLEGWFLMTAALLVLSGGSKLRDPEPTRGALRVAGLPSAGWAVSLLALTEIVLGLATFVVPSPLVPLGVAATYLGFAAFVMIALRRGLPLQSCGCFGRSDTPPGAGHLAVNLLAAAAAAMVAMAGGIDLWQILAVQPAAGVPYLGFVSIGTFLLALLLTDLPAVLARRPR